MIRFEDEHDGGTPVIERPPVITPDKQDVPKKPPMYAVMLHNDDRTPFQNVVQVLEDVFQLARDRAFQIMMAANNEGTACVVVLAKDVAETRVQQCERHTAAQGWPLKFTAEPEAEGD